MIRRAVKSILPQRFRRWVRQQRRRRPAVRWGDLRRLEPISRVFGLDRGRPIDRYYIEVFLDRCRDDIRGRTLEIGDAEYTRRFGGDRVERSDVLHAEAGNEQATLVGDLAGGAGVPADAFDCIILTQTLPFVFDIFGAVATVHAALREGGVVLATLPGISQISRYDMDRWGDYWRFTTLSARRLFEPVFGAGNVEVTAHGNVLAATAFLHGVAAEELRPAELDHTDDDYQVLITVRAVKSGALQ